MSAMGTTVGAVRLLQSSVMGKRAPGSYIEFDLDTIPVLDFSGASPTNKLGFLFPDLIIQ